MSRVAILFDLSMLESLFTKELTRVLAIGIKGNELLEADFVGKFLTDLNAGMDHIGEEEIGDSNAVV